MSASLTREPELVKAVCLSGFVLALVGAGCGSQTTTAPSTTTSGPTTETFSSALAAEGRTSHTFNSKAGTISITLTSVGPPSVVVGVGVGIPTQIGTNLATNSNTFAGCALTLSLNTGAGSTAQITAAVDAGTYCVEVYDVGNVPRTPPRTVGFALSIVHP